MKSFDDLLPQFLVDDVNEASTGHHQVVQLVEIQHLFGHNRQPCNRRTYISTQCKSHSSMATLYTALLAD